jgi:hypothetical protein
VRRSAYNPAAIDDYLHAVYSLSHGGRAYEFTFTRSSRAGTGRLAIDAPRPWTIISARNPMSVPLTDAANQERDRELAALLRDEGVACGAAEGRSPDGEWREPSSVVFGLTRERALAIARRFEQRAVVWGAHGDVGILDCWSERLVIRPVYGRSSPKQAG